MSNWTVAYETPNGKFVHDNIDLARGPLGSLVEDVPTIVKITVEYENGSTETMERIG